VADEIRRRFLEPLRLTHTVVLDAETRVPGTLSTAHAWCDVDGDGALEDVTSRAITWVATRSPALVYSTAEDLARWSQALYGGHVLDHASLIEVLTFHRPTPDAPGGPFATGYGLGTQEFRLGGLVLWGHLGWQYGYTSSMLYVPRHSASVIVLINDNNMMLINLAAIALCVVTQFHLETVRFTVLLGSTLLLLSTVVLWPLDYVARLRGRRHAGTAAMKDIGRRRGRTARWVAVLATGAIAAAAACYVGYSLDPATRLSWVGGARLSRAFIALSIGSTCVAIGLVYLAIRAWKDRLWSVPWRVHYALGALAALITASALSSLLF
jgi:hypothetical protein